MIELNIKIKDVDYGAAVESFLPMTIEKIAGKEETGILAKLLGKNSSLSTSVAKAALSVIPQNKKDEIAIAIIEKYKEEITKNLVSYAAEQGLILQVQEIGISSTNE